MNELKNFFIDIVDKSGDKYNYIRLTTFADNKNVIFGTYDENLSLKENSQASFSFKTQLYYGNKRNPFIDYLVNGRELRLTFEEDKDNPLYFIIIGISPTISNSNIIYNFSTQDTFSYYCSKQKINISLDTDDEEQWEEIGPKSINELVNKTLEISKISHLGIYWKLNPMLNAVTLEFPNTLYMGTNQLQKISFSVDNSTPYNILTEIAKQFNAIILINYKTHIIDFVNKEKMDWKGFILKPNTNLTSFSYSNQGSNLYNIMYIQGAEDGYGNYTNIMPGMPAPLSDFLLRTKETGLVSSIEKSLEISINNLEKIDYNEETVFSLDNEELVTNIEANVIPSVTISTLTGDITDSEIQNNITYRLAPIYLEVLLCNPDGSLAKDFEENWPTAKYMQQYFDYDTTNSPIIRYIKYTISSLNNIGFLTIVLATTDTSTTTSLSIVLQYKAMKGYKSENKIKQLPSDIKFDSFYSIPEGIKAYYNKDNNQIIYYAVSIKKDDIISGVIKYNIIELKTRYEKIFDVKILNLKLCYNIIYSLPNIEEISKNYQTDILKLKYTSANNKNTLLTVTYSIYDYLFELKEISENNYSIVAHFEGNEDEVVNNTLPWPQLSNDELYNEFVKCKYYANSKNISIGTAEEIQNTIKFLKYLQKIPQGSSFIYDFSYWKENGLIDENNYNNIDKLMTIGLENQEGLRNINLEYSIYSPLYYEAKYKLESAIKQEEEIIMQLAANDKSRANSNIEDNYHYSVYTDTYLDESGKEELFTLVAAGIENNLIYGKNYEIDMGNQIPPLNDITTYKDGFSILKPTIHFYKKEENKMIVINDSEYKFENSIITFTNDNNYPTSLYLKYSEYQEESQIVISMNDVLGNNDNELIHELLTTIWNDEYLKNAYTIYGINYFTIKKNSLLEEQTEKNIKLQELKTKMNLLLGFETEDYTSQNVVDFITNTESKNVEIEYYSLLNQIENLKIYLGGNGTYLLDKNTNKYTTFKGYYDYYLIYLNIFEEQSKNKKLGNLELVEKIKGLDKRKEVWFNYFYKKYGDIISETNYEDNNQIDSEGLYTSAYKQFLTYKQPTTSYSSSYVSTGDLMNYTGTVQIGDRIKLYNDLIFNENDDENYILYYNGYIPKDLKVISIIGETIQYGNVYNITNDSLMFSFNGNIDINKISFKYGNNNIRVQQLQKLKKSKPVELRITGITKTLRTAVIELSVEENTIYNTLVDRLLYNLK